MGERRFDTAIRAHFETESVRGGRGEIQNIGEHGLFVFTRAIPEQGERVRLQFRIASGEQFQLIGLVWWTRNGQPSTRARPSGFGVRLLEENAEYGSLVRSLGH